MNATASSCTEPGCTGSILDGYCDVCGSPGAGGTSSPTTGPVTPPAPHPARAAAPPARTAVPPPAVSPPAVSPPAVSAPAGPATADGTACAQPGCTGHLLDGYCDVCGTSAETDPDAAPMTTDSASARTRASNRLASTALGSARARLGGTTSTRRVASTSQRMRSARLGAGLTTIPPIPAIDASTALMAHPVVPENKRYCSTCGAKVGRGTADRPGRTTGFCPACRQPFSFDPKLRAGDLVAGQYEVAGCLAHGGLGWIYLAKDRNVSDRWVVLKGLLNTGDPDALAAAIAEQRFLAQVSHPHIVEIYNFVTHDDAGYIVMEYVGGTSLKAMLKQRMRAAGRYDPLPVDQALAYLIEILPAFQYLHDLGLVYCDFKPDNMIQVGDDLKLIDLGGVRRIDDQDSAIFGTVGYQAPEVAELGPSVASDIYTIGRTLVVLTMEFRGYQTTYVDSLPTAEDAPLFQQYDALYRLLLKACAASPDDRFVSADDLRVQMIGVLREVVAMDQRSGRATTSAASLLFEEPSISTDTLDWASLPLLRPDPHDPQAGWLHGVEGLEPHDRIAALRQASPQSPEVLLELARSGLHAADPVLVDEVTTHMLRNDPWEWRAVWLQGLLALHEGKPVEAQGAFNAVYGQVPGELAPKLALGYACERSNEHDIAESLYAACARTDTNYIPAGAFGMARIRALRGDVAGAVEALDLVPTTSRAFGLARQRRAHLLASPGAGLVALGEALDSVSNVPMDPGDKARLAVQVYEQALAEVLGGRAGDGLTLGGRPPTERGMRDALEAALRTLAKVTPDPAQRVALVDRANDVRPWSWT